MAFDLVIGTERAQALQNAIQDELIKRGYSPDADPVMAEYITIMLINNKTADQITTELQDLIGVNEYDAAFTEWLFAEANKRAQSEPQPDSVPQPSTSEPSTSRDQSATGGDSIRRVPSGPRSGGTSLYQQAVSQAIPSSSGASPGQKRSASIRSPSPNGQPNKARRIETVPTGPRAMLRDGMNNQDHGRPGRSLLDRMGGRSRNGHGHGRDEIQARIDAVTSHSPDPMQMGVGFNNGMNPMMMGGDMSAMGGMVNPLALQEMMVNQMALMAQMATSMGIINPQAQFPVMNGMNGAGFPDGSQGMFPQQQQQAMQGASGGNRRGGGTGGRGRSRGGGPAQWVAPHIADAGKEKSATPDANQSATTATPATIVAPSPQVAATVATPTPVQGRAGFVPPERPQSPTLCKFGLKCTNALCRYSHPSPVSTPESGVVLSNEPCEAGKDCKDKDCIKAHVSPAVLTAPAQVQVAPKLEPAPVPISATKSVPCRYGTACTKIHSGCPYSHPPLAYKNSTNASTNGHFNQQCRFGAACTRASCPFQHPPGRVLPSTFHRGLSNHTPIVSVPTPEAGSIGASSSPHKTVIFNKSAPASANTNGVATDKGKAEAGSVVSESKIVQATA